MINNYPRYIFFIGKGGVGKSTVSALTALKLSSGRKVLLVSMDPAHNQTDIFKENFSEKPLAVNNNLKVTEINTDKWIKNYLRETEDEVRKNYLYLGAFNLEKNFNIIKYSPGMEEYALLMAFAKLCEQYSSEEHIVFDMPPTALTTRFFSLPSLSLLWNGHLIKLREEIIKKKELITKIKLTSKEFESDKILNKLREQRGFHSEIKEIFEDKNKTGLNLVLNTDDLSVAESKRIIEKFTEINLRIDSIIINKAEDDQSAAAVKKKFEAYDPRVFKFSDAPLIGVNALSDYLSLIEGRI